MVVTGPRPRLRRPSLHDMDVATNARRIDAVHAQCPKFALAERYTPQGNQQSGSISGRPAGAGVRRHLPPVHVVPRGGLATPNFMSVRRQRALCCSPEELGETLNACRPIFGASERMSKPRHNERKRVSWQRVGVGGPRGEVN